MEEEAGGMFFFLHVVSVQDKSGLGSAGKGGHVTSERDLGVPVVS
jgi:hypothetical protein